MYEACRAGGDMTTGMMGDDEGLLTEQDVAGVLEVSLSTLTAKPSRVPGGSGKAPPSSA